MARDDEFAAFVAARYRALVRTGLLLIGDRGHAEDLAQSALIRTYLAWGRLRDPANAEAYARRTLVRLALRARQRRWTGEIAAGPVPDQSPDPAASAGQDELVLDVRRALAALPPGQRAVLVLRYLDDQSEAETARLLGISPGTVKSRTARGLASLRQPACSTSKEDAMTDEDQIRSLLTLAAELPDDIEPPIRPLLARGRRERQLRAILSVLSVVVIAAAAFALPSIARSLGPIQTGLARQEVPRGLFPAQPTEPETGPSAAQLARFRWSALPPSPLGPRSQPVLAWTGHVLLELGGPHGGVTRNEGAAFNPSTRTWRTIQVPDTIGLTGAASVWTGQQLFVTNGRLPVEGPAPRVGARAGLYDPARNRWSFTYMPFDLVGARQLSAAWTGRVIVIAGVLQGRIEAAAYNPAARHWSMISPTLPARHRASHIAIVATANQLIMWSFWDRVKVYKHGASDRAGVDVLSLGGGTWRNVTGHWPQEQDVASPTFTGHAILISPSGIWCGQICSPPPTGSHPGYVVNAVTLHRTAIPIGPLGQADPPFTWTGRAIIAVDLDVSGGRPALHEDDMALYDPAADHWRTLPAPPGYPRLTSPPVWASHQLLLLTASGGLLSFHA